MSGVLATTVGEEPDGTELAWEPDPPPPQAVRAKQQTKKQTKKQTLFILLCTCNHRIYCQIIG
jgi:hypothetical protein